MRKSERKRNCKALKKAAAAACVVWRPFSRFIKKYWKKALIAIGIFTAWVAIWEAVSFIVNQPLYVPSPYETVLSLGGLIKTSDFWFSILATFARVAAGLIIAFVLGCSIAYISAHAKPVETFLSPLVTAVKSTPVMSIIILALVWFKASFVPVFSCVLLCFPIFYSNTLSGIKSVDKGFLELAKVYNVKRARVIRQITLPSVLPYVYSALSLSLGFSWKSVVAAEVLSSPKYSMGFNLYETKLYLDTPELFAWTVAIIIVSIIFEKGLKSLLPKKGNLL